MVKLKKKTRQKLLIFIAIGILALAGGVSAMYLTRDKELPKDSEPKEEEPVKEPEKIVQVVDLNSNSRPYAVMINNNSAVWKYQSGLNDAYLVYEMVVEGGITREMALFKDSNLEKIQSVRSARHYFLDYALENDAIYVHWGWSPQAQSDISSLRINNLNGLTYEGRYFFRDSTIKGIGSEHKGYTTMEKLKEGAEKLNYRTTTEEGVLLSYSADTLDLTTREGVQEAKYVEIPYSSGYMAKFFYNEESKVYERSQNKTELIDYTSKERVVTKNIIVYNVGYKTVDSYGRQEMSNIGSGNGYYISEGKAVPITWEKSSRGAKTVYKYSDGSNLVVNDGTTYIGLQPNGRNANISADLPV